MPDNIAESIPQPMLERLLPELLEQLSAEELEEAEKWIDEGLCRCRIIKDAYAASNPCVITNG